MSKKSSGLTDLLVADLALVSSHYQLKLGQSAPTAMQFLRWLPPPPPPPPLGQ
jgi:hypothetical protein